VKQKIDRRLLRDINFLRFWGATVLSALGDSANYILLSWFIVDVTGSEGTLGTVLLCMSIPRLFFMLIGGVTADRINRKYILIFSVLARTLVLGVFSLVFGQGNTSFVMGTVYLMATLFGIVDAFFWPARDSMIPQVVPKEQLAAANSVIQTTQQISMVVGPLLASLLLHLTNYPVRFLTLAAVFLGSAMLLASLKFDPAANGEKAVDVGKSSALQDLAAGIRYVLTIRPITLIMAIAFFMNLLTYGSYKYRNTGTCEKTRMVGKRLWLSRRCGRNWCHYWGNNHWICQRFPRSLPSFGNFYCKAWDLALLLLVLCTIWDLA
jgi:MFS family permease